MRTLLCVVLLLLVVPGTAAAFLFELEALDVTGAVEFHDDFEDGDRSAPPTNRLLPVPGTAIAVVLGGAETETGGALRLTMDDEIPGGFPFEGAWLSDRFQEAAEGQSTVRWTVRLPSAPATPRDRLLMSVQEDMPFLSTSFLLPSGTGAGFALGWEVAGGLLSVALLGPVTVGIPGDLGTIFFGGIGPYGEVLVDPATVVGNLLFEIGIDHDASTMAHRFSIDGGATWQTPLDPVTVGAGVFGVIFGATDVPEPGLAALLAWAGLGLARLRRRGRRGWRIRGSEVRGSEVRPGALPRRSRS